MSEEMKDRISTLLKSIKVLREYQDIPLDAMSYLTGIDISRLRQIEEAQCTPTLLELQSILSAMDCHVDILEDRNDARPECLSKLFPKKRSVVLVVGNGFDRALGMHTLYSEFVVSPFWPLSGPTITVPGTKRECVSPLAGYIDQAVSIKQWSDLEAIMREFCIEQYEEQKRTGLPYAYADADHVAFKILSNALRDYLSQEQDGFLADNARLAQARKTTACHVLLDLIHSRNDVFVHSFNYTDIEKIAYRLDVEDFQSMSFEDWSCRSCWYHQIHSVIYGRKIVLGVEENCPMPESLSFLRKVNSPGFIPSNILHDLQQADSVVFFGHSLAPIDQCYFTEFFQRQSAPGLPADQSKEITIYTLNEKSGNAILTNIKSLEGVDLVNLMNNNSFSIEYTAGKQ